MLGGSIGQVHPSSTIGQYHHHQRPHCLQRRQRYHDCLQLHSELSLVLKKPVKHEAVLKVLNSRTTASLARTTQRINIDVVIKEVVFVFVIILVAVASCNEVNMLDNNSHLKFVRHSTTTESRGSSSHKPYSPPYHSPNVMTSTDSSSSPSSSFSSKVVIPESSLSLHAQYRTPVDSAQFDEPVTRAQILSLLISSLEKLHVLNKTDTSCFRLDKITITNNEYSSSPFSSTLQSPTFEQTTLGVHMFFRELPLHKSTLQSAQDQPQPSNQQPPPSIQPGNRSYKSSSDMILTHSSCVSDPVIEVHRMAVNSYTQEGRSQSLRHQRLDNYTPLTVENNTLQPGGLSRIQIVVISTCSGIIGMFFLIAGFLRLRNYIKRARMEQELARRPKFRSCSVALRGAAQSLEQLRRDSVASKVSSSHQNSLVTQGSNSNNMSGSQREISAGSLRHHLDQAPLLLNSKSAQALDTSVLASSHSSLKYIDEISLSPKKKDIPLWLVAKNNNVDKYILKDVSLVHYALDASTLLRAEVGSATNNAHVLKTSKQTGRFSGRKTGADLHPSSGSGSFKGRVLERACTPVVDHLQMTPRMMSCKMPRDMHTETMLRQFTKSGSTGQIGQNNTSNSDSRLNSGLDLYIQETEVGFVGDRIEGEKSKGFVASNVFMDATSPPRPLSGYYLGEAVSADLHCVDTKLQILEPGMHDVAAKTRHVDNVTTNFGTSSVVFGFGVNECDPNMACVTDKGQDYCYGTDQTDTRNSLELLASSNGGIQNGSFKDNNIHTEDEAVTMVEVDGVQNEQCVVDDNTKSLTQGGDAFSHVIEEHSVQQIVV